MIMTEVEIVYVESKGKNVDGGYAWIIMVAVCLSFVIQVSTISTGTLVYQELLVQFQLSATTAGWLISSEACLRLLTSPLVGLLYYRFSYRIVAMVGGLFFAAGLLIAAFASNIWMLFCGYGLLAGTGHNMAVMTTFIIIPLYFVKKRGLAMSVALCGCGIGSVLYPPIATASFRKFGYTQTMIFNAAVVLQIVVVCALYRPQTLADTGPEERDVTISKWEKIKATSGLGLLGQPVVFFLILSSTSMMCMLCTAQTYISGLAIERAEMNQNEIAAALSIGAFSEFSRLPVGFCFDLKRLRGPNRMYLWCFGVIMMGLLLAAITFSTHSVTFTICYTAFNIFAQCTHAQHVTMLGDIVSMEQLPNAISLTRTSMGISLLFVPLAVGRIKDVFDSFQYGFLLMSLGHTCIISIYTVLFFCWNRRKQNEAKAVVIKAETL